MAHESDRPRTSELTWLLAATVTIGSWYGQSPAEIAEWAQNTLTEYTQH